MCELRMIWGRQIKQHAISELAGENSDFLILSHKSKSSRHTVLEMRKAVIFIP